jgi:hypothetical protein
MLLECSKPKPGPPVVSISTTRETPNAFGSLQVGFNVGMWGRPGCETAADTVGGDDTAGGVDAACGFVDAGVGRSAIVPVTNSSFEPFAEITVAADS